MKNFINRKFRAAGSGQRISAPDPLAEPDLQPGNATFATAHPGFLPKIYAA